MTRQIRIVHHTGYSYPENVLGSHNEVRMTPRSTREQWVINSRIDIQPNPWVLNYTDYWGTRVTAFEIRERHSRLGVTSTATVEVTRPPEVAGPLNTLKATSCTASVTSVSSSVTRRSGLSEP